ICRQQLEPEPRLSGLYVIASRSCLLLVTNERDHRRGGDTIEPAQENGGPLVTGRVYGLEPRTGSLLWPVAATIEKYSLVLEQPSDLPIAIFARRLTSSGKEHQ